MEGDAIAQGEGILRQFIVRRVAHSQRRSHISRANREGEQGFVNLFAGAQGFTVGFIRAPQRVGFAVLHPHERIGAVAHHAKDFVPQRAGVRPLDILSEDSG